MSAQTKLFMDRCFAFLGYKKNVLKGKRIAIAMSYGGPDTFSSGCVNALRTFQDVFTFTGSKIVGIVHGSGEKAGEIKSNRKLMGQAEELGKELVAGL